MQKEQQIINVFRNTEHCRKFFFGPGSCSLLCEAVETRSGSGRSLENEIEEGSSELMWKHKEQ